jgi:hypothetical protein
MPVRGREKKAVDVFGESVQFWAGLQQSGRIESFEMGILDPHGGELRGFALLRGNRAQMDDLRAAEDFHRLVTQAQLIVEDLGVVHAVVGQGAVREMELFRSLTEAIA